MGVYRWRARCPAVVDEKVRAGARCLACLQAPRFRVSEWGKRMQVAVLMMMMMMMISYDDDDDDDDDAEGRHSWRHGVRCAPSRATLRSCKQEHGQDLEDHQGNGRKVGRGRVSGCFVVYSLFGAGAVTERVVQYTTTASDAAGAEGYSRRR